MDKESEACAEQNRAAQKANPFFFRHSLAPLDWQCTVGLLANGTKGPFAVLMGSCDQED